jgi:hypothetical protein
LPITWIFRPRIALTFQECIANLGGDNAGTRGLGALGAGLYSIGIAKDSVVKYEAALKTDQFLLIVNGTAAEVAKAKNLIETTHPALLAIHSIEAAKTAAV